MCLRCVCVCACMCACVWPRYVSSSHHVLQLFMALFSIILVSDLVSDGSHHSCRRIVYCTHTLTHTRTHTHSHTRTHTHTHTHTHSRTHTHSHTRTHTHTHSHTHTHTHTHSHTHACTHTHTHTLTHTHCWNPLSAQTSQPVYRSNYPPLPSHPNPSSPARRHDTLSPYSIVLRCRWSPYCTDCMTSHTPHILHAVICLGSYGCNSPIPLPLHLSSAY